LFLSLFGGSGGADALPSPLGPITLLFLAVFTPPGCFLHQSSSSVLWYHQFAGPEISPQVVDNWPFDRILLVVVFPRRVEYYSSPHVSPENCFPSRRGPSVFGFLIRYFSLCPLPFHSFVDPLDFLVLTLTAGRPIMTFMCVELCQRSYWPQSRVFFPFDTVIQNSPKYLFKFCPLFPFTSPLLVSAKLSALLFFFFHPTLPS